MEPGAPTPIVCLHGASLCSCIWLQETAWFIVGTSVDTNGDITMVSMKLPSGVSLCMRCGKCIEAVPEYAREQLLAIWNNPLPGQLEKEVILQVEGSHRAYDSEGPNPFRPRHVTGRKPAGSLEAWKWTSRSPSCPVMCSRQR